MSRSVVEPAAQPRKLMTNSVISKMTAMKEMIARHIPVAKVLLRVPSSLSENVFHPGISVAPGNWSSNEGKSSSTSTTHAHYTVLYCIVNVRRLDDQMTRYVTFWPRWPTGSPCFLYMSMDVWNLLMRFMVANNRIILYYCAAVGSGQVVHSRSISLFPVPIRMPRVCGWAVIDLFIVHYTTTIIILLLPPCIWISLRANLLIKFVAL